jgi:hypothetical protein
MINIYLGDGVVRKEEKEKEKEKERLVVLQRKMRRAGNPTSAIHALSRVVDGAGQPPHIGLLCHSILLYSQIHPARFYYL